MYLFFVMRSSIRPGIQIDLECLLFFGHVQEVY